MEKILFKKGNTLKSAVTRSICTPLKIIGKHKHQLQQADLSVSSNKSFNLAKTDIILVQVAYELQRPLDYNIGKNTK